MGKQNQLKAPIEMDKRCSDNLCIVIRLAHCVEPTKRPPELIERDRVQGNRDRLEPKWKTKGLCMN